MNEQTFRDIVSRQRRDLAATLLLAGLIVLSRFYELAISLRNLAYRRGWLKSFPPPVPTICVGNLTTGGTGKTPLVAWLCQQLLERCPDQRGAILTRGYRSGSQGLDEPALLAQQCPTLEVVINPDRVAGAQTAVSQHEAQWLVMDDGLQHRRLRRHLNIVAMDATCPYGYGRLLPAGLLREPINELRRAQAVVLTRADQVTPQEIWEIRHNLDKLTSNLVVAEASHVPQRIVDLAGREQPLENLAGRKILAFCGIGNPQAFYRTLADLKAEVIDTHSFSDHHACSEQDLNDLMAQAQRQQADLLVTTQKNALTLPKFAAELPVQIVYLEVAIEITAGRDDLLQLIEKALASTICPL